MYNWSQLCFHLHVTRHHEHAYIHMPQRSLLSESTRSLSDEDEDRTICASIVHPWKKSKTEAFTNIISQCCKNFPKSTRHLKILGTRMLTLSYILTIHKYVVPLHKTQSPVRPGEWSLCTTCHKPWSKPDNEQCYEHRPILHNATRYHRAVTQPKAEKKFICGREVFILDKIKYIYQRTRRERTDIYEVLVSILSLTIATESRSSLHLRHTCGLFQNPSQSWSSMTHNEFSL
jgi:hypothetical protein